MKKLPKSVVAYKKTSNFTEETVPKALLSTHYTKRSTWAKIRVLSGSLKYVIDGENPEVTEITKDNYGIIEPQIPHHLELLGSVEFYVEFYR